MADATFSVGSSEKHTIQVHWSLWTGRIIVLVDNSEIAKSGNAFGGERSIRFKIGEKEEHQIVTGQSNVHFNLDEAPFW